MPQDYNKEQGWWVEAKNKLISSFDANRFTELSQEFKENGGIFINEITEMEAITVFQVERLGLVAGASRPNPNVNREVFEFKLDFRIRDYNKSIFKELNARYVDVKSPLDSEVMLARNESYQSLEDQMDNILKSII